MSAMVIFWAVVCCGALLLYGMARFGILSRQRPLDEQVPVTSSEKLFDSKAYDAAFFDGESEQYAEALSRMRQYGGA